MTTADRVSRLIQLLAEEWEDGSSIEIAETLWLALHLEPAGEVVPDEPQISEVMSPPILDDLPEVDFQPDVPPPTLPPPVPRANIAAPSPQVGVLPPQVLPVWLADPSMLTDSLAVMRALRPLLQKAEAGTGKRLDESATVDQIARTQLCLPILEPEREPWFDLILVVDRGSSMLIWQQLVKDVVRILRRYGAFRDVQVFDLVINQADPSADDRVRLVANPDRPGRRFKELIDQSGRRIVIVLSDCAGVYWWDGTLLPLLQEWGKVMPTVVWQMLPTWMWKRTALGRGTAVAISNDIPGVANQRLKVRVQERDQPDDANQRVAVPVVTSEVRDLARWSLMVAGDRREAVPGFLLPQQGGAVPRAKGLEEMARDRAQQILENSSESDFEAAFHQALDSLAVERVERFLDLASAQAQRLMMLLAAAPVITLPVVRLIRDALLPEAQSPLPVAEVFLSGLLFRLSEPDDPQLEKVLREENERIQAGLDLQDFRQAGENEPELKLLERQDLLQYDFVPNVRNLLLKSLPAVDTLEVINSVSAAVERRWNRVSGGQDFRAFLMNPHAEVSEELKGLRSFASVTADILEQLGGEYASFARRLRQEEPPPPSEIETANFPELKLLQFIDAQLIDEADPEAGPPFPPPLQTEEFTIATITAEPEGETQPEDLQPFEFTVATLQRQTAQLRSGRSKQQSVEWQIQRKQGTANRFFEPLNQTGDILLEMVAISGGAFLMGAPKDEPEQDISESPQHKVTVQPFLMGRYPVTQLQWYTVATALPQVNRALNPDPSHFKHLTGPVENVSWNDAIEFCARLSQHRGRRYRLPTEAEWECACRAGTTTPFHFGETITTDLANYRGTDDKTIGRLGSYGSGPKGEYRQKTTPVDQFGLANAFGLCEMHGNVLEWCQDYWHENYRGAPADGSVWLAPGDESKRVLRGGSWVSHPRNCRSAFRSFYSPYDASRNIGFRVVCSARRVL